MPLKLRHALEVHSVHACDERKRQHDCRHEGQRLHDFVHAVCLDAEEDIERVARHLSVTLDEIDHAHEVIINVPKKRADVICKAKPNLF